MHTPRAGRPAWCTRQCHGATPRARPAERSAVVAASWWRPSSPGKVQGPLHCPEDRPAGVVSRRWRASATSPGGEESLGASRRRAYVVGALQAGGGGGVADRAHGAEADPVRAGVGAERHGQRAARLQGVHGLHRLVRLPHAHLERRARLVDEARGRAQREQLHVVLERHLLRTRRGSFDGSEPAQSPGSVEPGLSSFRAGHLAHEALRELRLCQRGDLNRALAHAVQRHVGRPAPAVARDHE